MTIRDLEQTLPDHPFFEGFDHETIALLAGCAHNVHFRPDELVFQEGQRADAFYLVRHGRVAIELHRPAGGPGILDTVEEGGVLGFSWLVPPYRWLFDARATEDTRAVSFDATCLRTKCDADPVVGRAMFAPGGGKINTRREQAPRRLRVRYRPPS